MKWTQIWLPLMAVMVLMFAGCSSSTNSVIIPNPDEARDTSYLPDEYCGEATIVPLIAGQNITVGEVIVTNDEEFIYVEFVTWDPWVLIETHVAVSDTLDGIPQTKKGSPKIGHFDYTIDSFIELSQWPDATELYIAAHAVVHMLGENGEVLQEETAWAKGEGFDKSWAMYFLYTIQECTPAVDDWVVLPDFPVEMIVNPGYWATFDTELMNIPYGEYTVEDWWYGGWCIQEDVPMEYGTTLWTYLYSSLAADLPPEASGYDWEMINYVINHTPMAATPEDIQEAIWYFTENKTEYPTDPEALWMVLAAEENGEGYSPVEGGTVAVICYVGPEVQLSIIQVDNS
ncbi:hypothetical protein J7L05_11390 [bacterium]|nr:hypothetical protein [bacterium]